MSGQSEEASGSQPEQDDLVVALSAGEARHPYLPEPDPDYFERVRECLDGELTGVECMSSFLLL